MDSMNSKNIAHEKVRYEHWLRDFDPRKSACAERLQKQLKIFINKNLTQ